MNTTHTRKSTRRLMLWGRFLEGIIYVVTIQLHTTNVAI